MDKALLEYEIKRNNLTIEEFCRAIEMSRSAFYRKCIGKTQFTLPEIKKITQLLHLKSPMKIFFAD